MKLRILRHLCKGNEKILQPVRCVTAGIEFRTDHVMYLPKVEEAVQVSSGVDELCDNVSWV